MAQLKVGDAAPDFSGTTTDGTKIALKDFHGKTLILYFYPKDDTPGCTAQACSLRDANAEIKKKGAAVLGVSTQDEVSHQRFAAKYNLNFPLLADTDKSVAKAYGALGGKSGGGGLMAAALSLAGFADRVTFVIGPDGKIAHIINSPDTKNHAEEVLSLI
jgi:peroxiredoxin Q/BCP